MRPIDLDQLVLLPRDRAVERGLDAGHARVLRLIVYGLERIQLFRGAMALADDLSLVVARCGASREAG